MKFSKPLASALNKEFPDKWMAIAVMLNLKVEYRKKEDMVYIEIGDNDYLTVTSANRIDSTFSLSDDLITKALIDAANESRTNK